MKPIYVDMAEVNRYLAARGIPIWSPRYWTAKGERVRALIRAQYEEQDDVE